MVKTSERLQSPKWLSHSSPPSCSSCDPNSSQPHCACNDAAPSAWRDGLTSKRGNPTMIKNTWPWQQIGKGFIELLASYRSPYAMCIYSLSQNLILLAPTSIFVGFELQTFIVSGCYNFKETLVHSHNVWKFGTKSVLACSRFEHQDSMLMLDMESCEMCVFFLSQVT